ncbi:TraX protein [Mycoplasma testudineum]|uniref:TraX protein n=1 Tax=Mycoplasma testudineum TaxID=244584 RepID=A0A4R6IE12_9MOLU|nr:TraX family protein [Mycoplasma testudineum]OYD26963.1 hypothetical protein CG473_01335 [Mycoplasma testudineum]TDO20510.1 TraX protein [Mycoplasma testudineum]
MFKTPFKKPRSIKIQINEFKHGFLSSVNALIKFNKYTFSWEFLTSTIIRWIAVITMFVDHFAFVALTPLDKNYVSMRIIGRIAFPIFGFLAGLGINYTSRKLYYVLRFLILAIVIHVFVLIFYFTNISTQLEPLYLNIMYILFLGTLSGFVHTKNNLIGFGLIISIFVILFSLEAFPIRATINSSSFRFYIDYQTYGYSVIITSYLAYYYFNKINHEYKLIFFKIAFIISFILINIIFNQIGFTSNIQLYSLVTIPLFLFYSFKKPYSHFILTIWFSSAYAISFILPALTLF